mmetsp:Transcript_29492/g.26067  ORF Transcript_29492/g.26067 Transcript_29492/m.26067 type:complete len:296 (+) Transcript_29492:86-973(+)
MLNSGDNYGDVHDNNLTVHRGRQRWHGIRDPTDNSTTQPTTAPNPNQGALPPPQSMISQTNTVLHSNQSPQISLPNFEEYANSNTNSNSHSNSHMTMPMINNTNSFISNHANPNVPQPGFSSHDVTVNANSNSNSNSNSNPNSNSHFSAPPFPTIPPTAMTPNVMQPGLAAAPTANILGAAVNHGLQNDNRTLPIVNRNKPNSKKKSKRGKNRNRRNRKSRDRHGRREWERRRREWDDRIYKLENIITTACEAIIGFTKNSPYHARSPSPSSDYYSDYYSESSDHRSRSRSRSRH